MDALIFASVLTGVIHLMETLATSMRLAGVRTKQVATSISFVNAILLVSRLSNMLQAPLLGGMVDTAILRNTVGALQGNFRVIIFASFVGNLIGAVLTPFAVYVFTKAIGRFEEVGSLPRVMLFFFHPRNLMSTMKGFRLPTLASFKGISLSGIPKTFLILNVIVVSIYAIGVLSSLQAGAEIPSYRTTATQLSGIVNGIATILLALLVDPVCAHITDQAVRGRRKESDVRTMVVYIIMGRVLGTLILSQLLFLPATEYVQQVTVFMKGMFLK
jgi:hypothetical protein